MKVIELTSPATERNFARSLTQGSRPDPKPQRGEVLLQLRAASLNYIDVAVARGQYPGVRYPVIPVADGAAEVVDVGDGVDTLREGDRVAIHPKALWNAGRGTARNAEAMRGVTLPGALRQFAVATPDSLVLAPDHLSWFQLAATPIAATTAWNALEAADIKPGSSVLLLGTGGVSVMALQLAKARGAQVIVTSSSDAKLERARTLGADHLVNYRQVADWATAARQFTDGRGVDLVVETVGAQTFAQSIDAVRQGGTVFTIGFLTGLTFEVNLLPVVAKAVRVIASNTGSAENLADALAAIAACRVEPVVDRRFELGALAEAYGVMDRGSEYVGKLAIELNW